MYFIFHNAHKCAIFSMVIIKYSPMYIITVQFCIFPLITAHTDSTVGSYLLTPLNNYEICTNCSTQVYNFLLDLVKWKWYYHAHACIKLKPPYQPVMHHCRIRVEKAVWWCMYKVAKVEQWMISITHIFVLFTCHIRVL